VCEGKEKRGIEMTYEEQLGLVRHGRGDEVWELLVNGGFDYFNKPVYMASPLYMAIGQQDHVILEMILKVGMPVDYDWHRGNDISLAIQTQDVESVVLLLKYGVSCAPEVSIGGYSVLGYAVNELEFGDNEHPSEKKQRGVFIVLLLIAAGFLNYERNKLAVLMTAVCTSSRVTAALLATKSYDNPRHAVHVNKLIEGVLPDYKLCIANAWRKSISFTTLLLCDSSSSSLRDEEESPKRTRNE